MELLYQKEHLSCVHYDDVKKPQIEIREIGSKEPFRDRSNQCALVFVLEGSATYKLRSTVLTELNKGQIVLVPSRQHFTISTEESAKLLIIRLAEIAVLCECFPIENLLNFKDEEEEERTDITLLETNSAVNTFTAGLTESVEYGLRCQFYLAMKTRELFYLLRAYYPKERLAQFLKEILYTDAHFSYIVQRNYQGINCVSEFAKQMGMKKVSFEKRFKKIFEIPPYQWIVEQKTKDIRHALCVTNTPLKELAARFGFFSKSSFSDFCKKNLGAPPGQIRKNVGGTTYAY